MLDQSYFIDSPFSWDSEKKKKNLTKSISKLNKYHLKNCKEYEKIITGLNKKYLILIN